jgi:TonB family protein
MPQAWKELEGRVINKEFRLGDYLGGSDDAGVFVTQYGPESLKAALKLIPIGRWDAATVETELSLLQSARELSHPHLLQIFQAGRTTIDDRELLFVVMEYADEDLSQFLPKRALAAAEVRDMLGPTLDALAYLHSKGFVHGHLRPANVLATGDQLKLSSDGISRIGARRGPVGKSSEYDAPEVARGENSAASDVWSLGMLLVMALTQRLPAQDASEEPVVTDVPAPFGDVARHCLQRDPGSRWGLADIAERLDFPKPANTTGVTKADMRRPSVPSRAVPPRAVAGPQSVPRRKAIAGPRDFPYQRRSNAGAYIAVAIVVAIVGIFVGPRLFRGGAGSSQTDSTAQRSSGAATTRATSAIAQVSDESGGAEGARAANSRPIEKDAEASSAARAKASRRGLTPGQVAQQVVPDVPRSARDTIRGTVRVGVRIGVDSAGNVTEAELDSPGPSKYFAHLALEAAQQWRFEPPKVEGRNVLSDWLLHFQFTGEGTKVIPVQSDP